MNLMKGCQAAQGEIEVPEFVTLVNIWIVWIDRWQEEQADA
jgi:hypothetical protein